MTPFTDLTAYRAWANQQVCAGCGMAFKDRPRDSAGKVLDVWATETECMKCLTRRTHPTEKTIQVGVSSHIRLIAVDTPPTITDVSTHTTISYVKNSRQEDQSS